MVLISLSKASENTPVATTLTNASGAYLFSDLEPGDYNVLEQNLPAFPIDTSDRDTTSDGDPADLDTAIDNKVGVKLEPGETDDGNDFVDSNKGRITGSVKDNNVISINEVILDLKDSTGAVIKTVMTTENGEYAFDNVPPGEYSIVEINPDLFPVNISDQDDSNDGDPADTNTVMDNIIGIKLEAGETNASNDFVDRKCGSISGHVNDNITLALSNVTVELRAPDGTVVRTTTTNAVGSYIFQDILPSVGLYIFQDVLMITLCSRLTLRDTQLTVMIWTLSQRSTAPLE